MKNNDFNGNKFEKLLKDKMNKLSSSVDCFDKISARAFPEKKADFSESGFVVCDLENVTGRSRKLPFLKWTAFIVACVMCVIFIPKSAFFDNLIANFSKSSKKTYNTIVDEINRETAENSYKVYDMPLEDYIKYDKLVTPLYECPFEDCGKDGVNVRIFVRTYNDIPTNQIYAVEYMGEYSKSDFIAVADSKAKFTSKDFENIDSEEVAVSDQIVKEAVNANFIPVVSVDACLTDKYKNKISVVSFDYTSIFKDNYKVQKVVSQVLYYGDKIYEPEKYYYDVYNTPNIDTKGAWKHSVCFDGFMAFPEKSGSLFIQTPLFGDEMSEEYDSMFAYITTDNFTYSEKNKISFYSLMLKSYDDRMVSEVAVPYDKQVLETLKMYFSQSGMIFSSYSDVAMVIKSENRKKSIYKYSEDYHLFLNEEKASAEAEKKAAEELIENERYKNNQS